MKYICRVDTARGVYTKIYDVADFAAIISAAEAEFGCDYKNVLWVRPTIVEVTNPDGTWINQNKLTYDYKSFTVAPATVDYDVAATQSDLFDTVTTANKVEITTTADIYIKFNSSANSPIPVTSSGGPRTFTVACTNIFITSAA